MKTCALLVFLALGNFIASAEAALRSDSIEGWGAAHDPAGDCQFSAEAGELTITVPGSEQPHDISSELTSMTAPLVLRKVAGDFIVQVKLDGTFNPSGQSTEQARSGYTGAGLVVFADKSNYVRIERATLHFEGEKPRPYTNFEIRADGDVVRIGNTTDFPTDSNKPTWLRLERRGRKMLGAMSQDGKHWSYGEPKELDTKAWERDELSVGVAAISTSTKSFAPIYSNYLLHKIPKGALKGADGKATPTPIRRSRFY